MCGIVAAVAQRQVLPILIEGLKRLEYRGYDSAGVALLGPRGLQRCRALGKVASLEAALQQQPMAGRTGIAHTRWATHGAPAEHNAHPHQSRSIALVHNGIIENHGVLREALAAQGYVFTSDTDTEVIAHLLQAERDRGGEFRAALTRTLAQLSGAFALAIVDQEAPESLWLARKGSPLVIGVGIGEHFAASDALALLPVTNRMVYLDEGDIAEVHIDGYRVWDAQGQPAQRAEQRSSLPLGAVEKGPYRHFMAKEIHEQPQALRQTLQGRTADGRVLDACLGPNADALLSRIDAVHIAACGTSAHAGQVARYAFEQLAQIPCQVELASEFRYRAPLIAPNTLFITISQSGETADTLEALRHARRSDRLAASLVICNAPESSLVRESDIALMTHAGPERSVASTKAFTTQLMALSLIVLLLARRRGAIDAAQEAELVAALHAVPGHIEQILAQEHQLRPHAERLMLRHHALFLGRGAMWPVAMEGALKLKEVSYIHAEAYAAGELKHGPLALVDDNMPVVAVAPRGDLLDKVKSNLQEVRARGGELLVLADADSHFEEGPGVRVLAMPHAHPFTDPMIYTVPLQLLAYQVAVLKGTDVDQPRNLAKSVTVE
jgi:glutamine---fructose-6-phosphate transaminase (isomerizing)